MSFTQRMINRASFLLHKYGTPMTLKRTVSGEYHASTGKTDPDVITTFPCYGIIQFITRTSADQFYGTATLQDTLIQKNDKMCYLTLFKPDVARTFNETTQTWNYTLLEWADLEFWSQGLDITPSDVTDRLIVGSVEYNVMFVTPLESKDTDIMYVLQIRK